MSNSDNQATTTDWRVRKEQALREAIEASGHTGPFKIVEVAEGYFYPAGDEEFDTTEEAIEELLGIAEGVPTFKKHALAILAPGGRQIIVPNTAVQGKYVNLPLPQSKDLIVIGRREKGFSIRCSSNLKRLEALRTTIDNDDLFQVANLWFNPKDWFEFSYNKAAPHNPRTATTFGTQLAHLLSEANGNSPADIVVHPEIIGNFHNQDVFAALVSNLPEGSRVYVGKDERDSQPHNICQPSGLTARQEDAVMDTLFAAANSQRESASPNLNFGEYTHSTETKRTRMLDDVREAGNSELADAITGLQQRPVSTEAVERFKDKYSTASQPDAYVDHLPAAVAELAKRLANERGLHR